MLRGFFIFHTKSIKNKIILWGLNSNGMGMGAVCYKFSGLGMGWEYEGWEWDGNGSGLLEIFGIGNGMGI